MWSVVVLQYSSRLVSRQTADLHQLSGKHFSDRLTLERRRGRLVYMSTDTLHLKKRGLAVLVMVRTLTLFLTAPWLNSAKEMSEQDGLSRSSSSLPPSPSSSLERHISVRFWKIIRLKRIKSVKHASQLSDLQMFSLTP